MTQLSAPVDDLPNLSRAEELIDRALAAALQHTHLPQRLVCRNASGTAGVYSGRSQPVPRSCSVDGSGVRLGLPGPTTLSHSLHRARARPVWVSAGSAGPGGHGWCLNRALRRGKD